MRAFYERRILPRFIESACSTEVISRQRALIVPSARGRVLELGFGSGLNLEFYDDSQVEHVWALDPSAEMMNLAEERIRAASFSVERVVAGAEAIPIEDASADTVVVTYSLCTIPDVPRALEEVRRVLKPGGRLLFCEHGASPEANVRRWQDRINPLWSRLAGGCQLNRPIADLLRRSGYALRDLSTGYTEGWKIDSYHYWGVAIPAS